MSITNKTKSILLISILATNIHSFDFKQTVSDVKSNETVKDISDTVKSAKSQYNTIKNVESQIDGIFSKENNLNFALGEDASSQIDGMLSTLGIDSLETALGLEYGFECHIPKLFDIDLLGGGLNIPNPFDNLNYDFNIGPCKVNISANKDTFKEYIKNTIKGDQTVISQTKTATKDNAQIGTDEQAKQKQITKIENKYSKKGTFYKKIKDINYKKDSKKTKEEQAFEIAYEKRNDYKILSQYNTTDKLSDIKTPATKADYIKQVISVSETFVDKELNVVQLFKQLDYDLKQSILNIDAADTYSFYAKVEEKFKEVINQEKYQNLYKAIETNTMQYYTYLKKKQYKDNRIFDPSEEYKKTIFTSYKKYKFNYDVLKQQSIDTLNEIEIRRLIKQKKEQLTLIFETAKIYNRPYPEALVRKQIEEDLSAINTLID